MISLFRHPVGFTVACILAATALVLPPMFFRESLLILALISIVGIVFFLFTRPLYALLAYVVLIPFEELAVFAALGTPTRLAGILFFATYLFHRRFQINWRVMPLAAWLWLGWITASLTWSPQPSWAYYFQTLQLFIATLLIIDYVSRAPEKLKTILNGYTVSAFIITMLGIYNFFAYAGNVSGLSSESRTSGIEGQGVETFAFSLIPAFLTAFHYVITSKRTSTRWFNAFLMLLFAMGMILSGTRGSWVATIAAIMIVYLPRLNLRHYLSIIIAVILGTFVVSQIPAVVDFARYRASDAVSSGGAGRTDIWLVAWQMYLEYPVIGKGWSVAEKTMDVRYLERVSGDITWNDGSGRFKTRNVHNIYLQVLVELGVVGFILFILWFLTIITAPVHLDKHVRSDWLLVLAIFVAFLVGGITNPELHKKYFWFALALPHGLRYYWLYRFRDNQTEQQRLLTPQHLSTP
ncbi:MAG: O-antigen ligase family protein [Trueperaceae bacterium]